MIKLEQLWILLDCELLCQLNINTLQTDINGLLHFNTSCKELSLTLKAHMNLSMHCPCNIKADKSTQGPYFLSSHPSWKLDFPSVLRAASGDISVIAHLSERSKSSRSLRGRVCNPASSQSNYSDQPAKVDLNLTRNAYFLLSKLREMLISIFSKLHEMIILWLQSFAKWSCHHYKVGHKVL